jgi:hypothetical protein
MRTRISSSDQDLALALVELLHALADRRDLIGVTEDLERRVR